jgi:hypothetical protein
MYKRFIFVVLFSFFILSTSFISFNIYVSGKISTKPEFKQDISGIQIFVKFKGDILQKALIDTAGNYSLDFLVGHLDSETYDFYITSLGIDTSLIRCIRQFDGEEVTWNFKLPYPYTKKSGKIVCPKCQKTDLVYPIVFGKAVETIRLVGHDTIRSKVLSGKYYEGTCVQNHLSPAFYCDRDKVKF